MGKSIEGGSNSEKGSNPEIGSSRLEYEENPGYRFMITRHAERLPSGELSPEGIEHSKRKGAVVKKAEVLKAYASDHKSKRAFKTGDLISKESGIVSPVTGKQYATREVADIQYDVMKPDYYDLIAGLKILIEEPTLAEAYQDQDLKQMIEDAVAQDPKIVCKKNTRGEPMIDIEKLPVDVQMKIAPIRQSHQKRAFEVFLSEQPEAVHRLAMGLGHQLVKEMEIAKRYSSAREKMEKPPEKEVILNTATHGLFMESLLQEAGVYVAPDGQEIEGIKDFQSEDFGGYIQPAESIYLDVEDPAKIPERIPVNFEGPNRPRSGRVFIDRKKLEGLNKDYLEWKKSLRE